MSKFKPGQKVVYTEGVHAIAKVICKLPFKKTCYPFGKNEKTQAYLIFKTESMSSRYPTILSPVCIVAEKGLEDLKKYLHNQEAFFERNKKYIGENGYSQAAANTLFKSTERLKAHL